MSIIRCTKDNKVLGEWEVGRFVVDYKGKRTELNGNGHVRVSCPLCETEYIVLLDNGTVAMILYT